MTLTAPRQETAAPRAQRSRRPGWRNPRLILGLLLVAASVVVSAPPAQADPDDGVALNGTYTAFSDGVWAKTNDSFHDERSVTQTWTITTTCSTAKIE